jgi:hypothetical protein
MVNELYGLTEDEIKIVESLFKYLGKDKKSDW